MLGMTDVHFEFGDLFGFQDVQMLKPAPLLLCGRALPWVARAEHLGHALSEDGTMRQDAREKRAKFIDMSVKI